MTDKNVTFFTHGLELKLTLEADGEKVELFAGSIEKITLDLHSYGFNCFIRFIGIDNEKLNSLYNSEKVTKMTLVFMPEDPGPPLLELKGIVIEKKYTRTDEANHGRKLPIYNYEMTICDNASAAWGEHFPINIYVDKSMKDVLEDQKNPEISMKYDFPALEQKHPITAFCVPYNNFVPKNQQVSFYSFLTWYLHQEGGILAYDYQAHTYSILGKKEPEKGEPYKIYEVLIAPPFCISPPIPRFNSKTIKHSPDALDAEDKANENSFKSVRRDSMDSANYRIFPEHALESVKSPLDPLMDEIQIQPRYFEEDFHIDKLIPGSFVTFTSDAGSWSGDPRYKDKVFRSRFLSLNADQSGITNDEKAVQEYKITLKVILEPKEEVFIERPSFSPPEFPFAIHGKVFSDEGDKEQSTYKISEGEEAPQGQYLVKVPLAGEDQKIVVPFTPDLKSGQQYFPLPKDQKVLLSMYFRTAKIERIIDWQPFAKLPTGVQGSQIVWASNGKDIYALMKHEFEDGKNSVIAIKQATSSSQTQNITLKDKEILIAVEQKDQKTLLIRFNVDEGVLISLNDKTSKMTQEILLDGKQITHTCKDENDTSIFVQKPDSLTFTGKAFNVIADKITLEAKDTINQKAPSNMNIEAPVVNVKGKMKVAE